jgi:peptidylprolyl isomerase/peptidyl-prolyl cis-trans isomerase D
MAVMTSLRDKTHIILYALLAAFLALIVFEWGMNFSGFSGKKRDIAGKVNGKDISAAQYEEVYNEISGNFRRTNPGAEITPVTELEFRQQAWNIVVDQTLLEEQFAKFGITVQDQEVVESLDSPEPPMIIRQNFSDSTGSIDRKKLDVARRDPKNKDLWLQLEKMVQRELKVNKLIRALQPMVRVTGRELDDIVRRNFGRFSASFVPVPLSFAGTDTSFPVKEDEIQKYYNEHKELLKQLPSRSVDYVFFPLTPSSKDSSSVRSELESLRSEFSAAVNDTDYVKVQSDRPNGVNVLYNRANFSLPAGSIVFSPANLKAGAIVGPVADRGEYRLLKIKEVRTAQPIARASHILLRFNQGNKEEVEKVRERMVMIFKNLQAGVPFETLAGKYSEDPGSAVQGGDLGWFTRESMLPEFSAAVFSGTPGAVVKPVQTKFGLHIIKVTGFDQTAVIASEIVRTIRPSTETVDSARRLAMAFQMQAKDKGLEKSASTEKLVVGKTGDFGKHTLIADIGFSDKITAFAFNGKEGALSDVIETEKGFYVMKLTGVNDTGYRRLDADLKKRITAELVRLKKEPVLEKKLSLNAKQSGATLDKIAAAYPGTVVVTADDIRWVDGFIPGYGFDQPLVEAMSAMTEGKLSGPVKTNDGYAIVLLSKKNMPAERDVEAAKTAFTPKIIQDKLNRLFTEYFATIKKNAVIEDLRP